MRRAFVVFMTASLVLVASSSALADRGDIPPTTYDLSGKTWTDNVNGTNVTYNGYGTSTHRYGTWNSPYTTGVDGYNYNDAQDYTEETGFGGGFGDGDTVVEPTDTYGAGPHGGYMTTTHRCRECHAVHRAAGKFKLLRANTRFEACDWCHGFGAGSGFNIQMDNDDNFTTEYNVGHTIGFGISGGKWKAPDDTFPAYTPNYWLGGFSCFDCHSPHANPQRLLGYDNTGVAVGISGTNDGDDPLSRDQRGLVFSIANPGHDAMGNDTQLWNATDNKNEPIYLAGSWLLIKNADLEVSPKDTTETVTFWNLDLNGGNGGVDTYDIEPGQEIPDYIASLTINGTDYGNMFMFDDTTSYPVNKIPINWDSPVGPAGSAAVGSEDIGFSRKNMSKRIWNVSEFCTDCHDGNAGLHTVAAPLFSEDRALRDQGNSGDSPAWSGNFDIAYGHDTQPRH